MAQDGAIDACAIYGRVYCRRIVRVTPWVADAVRVSITLGSDGWARERSQLVFVGSVI
jgi:hypothetical protein